MRTIRRDANQPAQRLRAWQVLPRAGSLRLPVGSQSRREDGGYVQTGVGGKRPDRPARDPGGPRSDALGPGSSEITEGFGDHRNPP